MSGLSQEQIDWTKAFTGIDFAAVAAAPAPAAKPPPSAKGFADRFRGGKTKAKPAATPPPPADTHLAAKLKQLEDDIASVAARKFGVGRMRSDLNDLKTRAAAAEKEPDEKKRAAAIAAVSKTADEELAHVGALEKSIKDILGDKHGAPSEEKRSQVYQSAIKTFYKLDLDVPKGMKNTHFDRVFDMLGTVPEGDVKQDQLKHLVYNKADIGGVYYPEDYDNVDEKTKKVTKSYKAGSIELGNFGNAKGEEVYEIEGKKLKANSFDVTTLHEIGHSVDQKNGIMNKHQNDNGCGNWSVETADKVANAYLQELKTKLKLPDTVTDASLLAVINTALDKGTVTQTADLGNHEWQHIARFLITECVPMTEAANPFFNPKPVVVSGRVYTQSGGTWYSYAAASRTATLVNNYQWRSPAEWFAEVYAITWLKKKKPPSAVPADVAQYCWKG